MNFLKNKLINTLYIIKLLLYIKHYYTLYILFIHNTLYIIHIFSLLTFKGVGIYLTFTEYILVIFLKKFAPVKN